MPNRVAFYQSQCDRFAKHYDRYAVCQRRIAQELLSRVQQHDSKPDRILDLGSGTGSLCDLLREQYPQAHVFATDRSLSMLQVHRAKHQNNDKLRQVCASFDDLPFQPECFDLIVSNMALHWSQNISQCWANLFSLLRPGGMLLVTLSGPGTFQEWQTAWQEIDDLPHLIEFHIQPALLVICSNVVLWRQW